jgi:hypothetical protein
VAFGVTLDDVVSRVRRDWQATLRPTAFALSANYTAGGTTLSLDGDLSGLSEGSIAAVGTNLLYITATGSSSLTVLPGWEGAPQTNAVTGDFCEIDPKIPKLSLVEWAEQEIDSWGSQLWRAATVELDTAHSSRIYELVATDVIFLLDVRGRPVGTSGTWLGGSWPKMRAQLIREAPVADFASGLAIQFESFPAGTDAARVVYAAPFDLTTFDLTTDLVATCGLERSQIDVLEAGLKHRLLDSGLVTRTDWQGAGMSRDSEEVTSVDIVRAADMARSRRDRRLAEEALELRRVWGLVG